MGITGTRGEGSVDAALLASRRVCQHADLLVAVGLGVSNHTQAA